MKIMLFVRSFEVGGTQRQLAILAAGLAKRGHHVVAAVFYTGGPNEKVLEGSSVQVVDLVKSSRWDFLRPIFRLRRIIRKEKFDIFYALLPTQTSLAGLFMPLRSRPRLVFGTRAAGMKVVIYDLLSKVIYRLEVLLSFRATLIISNSNAGREDAIIRGMSASKIIVIPNGIDTEKIKPDRAVRDRFRRAWNISDECFVIGLVARLDPMKDHETFLVAASILARFHSDVHFVCVGGGSGRESLKNRADELGLADRLTWAGEISDAHKVYNAFDIATLSSVAEGFPNVIGEAMACGTPVVATDVGDSASIIGDLGIAVPPRRPDLLCAGWARLRQRMIDEPDLGVAVRNRITANYDLDQMVSRTEKVFAKICQSQRPQL